MITWVIACTIITVLSRVKFAHRAVGKDEKLEKKHTYIAAGNSLSNEHFKLIVKHENIIVTFYIFDGGLQLQGQIIYTTLASDNTSWK